MSDKFVCFLLLFLAAASTASAFGAGEVPDGSPFKEYVWRHGDIVEVLRFLPVSFITHECFTQLQRRQIYFGNWLRDFSQVVDTTCLENVPEPILRAIVSVLAMLEFGFATDEFEVTRERLGCYTHVEHIDNPRGYDNNARSVDDRLRGPVNPRELEFDPKTGMKNYIAHSGHGWDTSADYVRRQLKKCIDMGRKGREGDHNARKEAFIHLGAALHTLEDFAAHSNFIELCFHEMGETDVFAFVGDMCKVRIPSRLRRGRHVSPLVTGTFGMLDIFHSLLGEADDMAILQSKGSLGELEDNLDYGAMAFDQLFQAIKTGISTLQNFSAENTAVMEQLEAVNMIFRSAKNSPSPTPEPCAEQEDGFMDASVLWQAIEPIFFIHDRMKKWLRENGEAKGFSSANNTGSQMSDYTNKFVFQFLGVVIQSSIKELRNALKAAKVKVDEEAAQSCSAEIYEDGSTASDPSHSDLSKDHFSNVLNPPAGLIATVTTNWTTQQVVKCWDNPTANEDKAINDILSILHHPAFPKKKSKIQDYMFKVVQNWWHDTPKEEQEVILARLSRESVRVRGHEDHKLTMEDVKGKRTGPGQFPGCTCDVRPPRTRESFPLKWAINEAVTDISWALGTMSKCVTVPGGHLVNVAQVISGLVVNTARATGIASRSIIKGARDVAAQWWPFS
ncbi:heterokaryon incompatibility Het-C [Pochonia chlamydosporia 170]|uniref:Heterokaryon incompatibility Het-C n=1 Tax=Pochonia chlamydosporia 170 TaxID=1380566 RepID=A0A179F7T6_METCM|nr:heterokaryon incompatibility Het-C [Pochonia chlamydosporia 170]OAQ61400.2 heterokaryon incompatibility Het-C [Pochonia chlamydosporia 170]